MNEAVQNAVEWLNAKIVALTECRDNLIRCFQDLDAGLPGLTRTGVGVQTTGRPEPVEPPKHARPAPVKKKTRTNTDGHGPARTGRPVGLQEVDGIGALLKEPFGVSHVMEAGECDKKTAIAAINRWSYNGWIERVVFGKYRRTALFGGESIKAQRREQRAKSTGEAMLEEIHKEIDAAKPKEDE